MWHGCLNWGWKKALIWFMKMMKHVFLFLNPLLCEDNKENATVRIVHYCSYSSNFFRIRMDLRVSPQMKIVGLICWNVKYQLRGKSSTHICSFILWLKGTSKQPFPLCNNTFWFHRVTGERCQLIFEKSGSNTVISHFEWNKIRNEWNKISSLH